MRLRLKINESKRQTEEAIIEEQKGDNLCIDTRKQNKMKMVGSLNVELEKKGLEMGQIFLNESAQKQEICMKRKKKNQSFGWDVFNEDSLYQAYKKKCQNIPFNED